MLWKNLRESGVVCKSTTNHTSRPTNSSTKGHERDEELRKYKAVRIQSAILSLLTPKSHPKHEAASVTFVHSQVLNQKNWLVPPVCVYKCIASVHLCCCCCCCCCCSFFLIFKYWRPAVLTTRKIPVLFSPEIDKALQSFIMISVILACLEIWYHCCDYVTLLS